MIRLAPDSAASFRASMLIDQEGRSKSTKMGLSP